MAASSNFFQAQNIALFVSLTFFLLLRSSWVSASAEKDTVSFSFGTFVPDSGRGLILQADAETVTQTERLRLNKVEGGKAVKESRGRALYSAPVHIWDKRSGNVANFDTSFSFVITAPTRASDPVADGLAFFLAPVDTQPKKAGGFLGLFENENKDTSNQIVAVEFDTFANDQNWDPKFRHIGIDVNSIKSTQTVEWDFRNDTVADVYISYKASSKILMATLNYPISGKSFIVTDVVDLKQILPEWVKVGLSGATGVNVGIHEIISWSFRSELSISTGTEAFVNKTHLSSFVQRA